VWIPLRDGDRAFGLYSDDAAAATLACALGLWADTAASMGDDGSADDG
jgi:hypothetical protein